MNRWAVGIALGLTLVVLVNAVFIWIAFDNPPQVLSSYEQSRHR
jgi:hypothetical protein